MVDFEKKVIEDARESSLNPELEQKPQEGSENEVHENSEKNLENEAIFEELQNESDELSNDVLELSKESIDKISKEDIENLAEKQRSLVEKLENLRNDSEVCEKLEKSLDNSLDILEQLNKQLSNYKKLALDLDLDSEILTQGDENIGENDELDENSEEKVYHFSREDFIKEEGEDDKEISFKTLKEFKEDYPNAEISKATYSRFLKNVKNNPDEVLEFKPRKKTSFEDIEHKNPYDFVPKELKDNPSLVVFDKELFEMPNDEFMAKFNVSKNIKFRLKNFYKENGYAWFLSQEDSEGKVNRKYTCYSYEDANKKEEFYNERYSNWYREKYADQMDRINEILEGGREDDPIRYSAPVDDMIEIKLEDFFVDGVTPKDIANKYPGISTQYLNAKVEKMIQNGYINTFVHKDGKENMSVQTREINFLEIDGKKSFPEWYNQKVLEFKPRKKTSFEDIEHKNPYDFVPKELKDNPSLVVFDKELFEMPNDEFMAKFNVSKNIKFRLKNFYKENGYAWFLSQEDSEGKVNRKYTCYSYEDANKKEEFYNERYSNWYREKYADQMDRINEILEGGREDDPIRYSAPVDDMIEIKLEDFFVDGVTPKDIVNKYPGINTQFLNTKVEKMIQNGYINTFIHKDGKNNMSVQTRKINFLEIDGKKSFPEWYNQETLEKDVRLGKFFIIREHPVLREILEKYDDEFRSEAQTRLFELAGEEKFNDEPWRIQVVKSIGLHFLRKIDKLNKEVSINTKNRENDDFSLMATISAEKTGFEFEKNLIDEDTIEEVLYRIKAKNYDEYDKYEDDIEFVTEYLGQDYSTDAEDEEDRKRWEREAKEDEERFNEILKRNSINLEDFV